MGWFVCCVTRRACRARAPLRATGRESLAGTDTEVLAQSRAGKSEAAGGGGHPRASIHGTRTHQEMHAQRVQVQCMHIKVCRATKNKNAHGSRIDMPCHEEWEGFCVGSHQRHQSAVSRFPSSKIYKWLLRKKTKKAQQAVEHKRFR